MNSSAPARSRASHAGGDARGYEALWRAWDEFFVAVNKARGRAAREQAEGLTIPQFHLLSAVAESPSARSGELAEAMGVSAPTTTKMLSGLERAGIVRRRLISDDRRGVSVTLTPKGRWLLQRKQATVAEKRRALYESLTPVERRGVQRLLRRLAEAVEAL